MNKLTLAKVATVVGAGLVAAAPAYAVDLVGIFGNIGRTGNAFRSMASILAVAAGVGGVGWGLYQAFIARADDPQISFGKNIVMAFGGGMLAAFAASTNTFQETVFGTTGQGNQTSSQSPF